MKIIIADDSELIHERLTAMTSELPECEIVGQARDGGAAIKLIKDRKPDVVVLDIRMPKRNGIDVLKNIKKYNSIPRVIIFTNYPYPQYKTKCAALGADYFLDKTTEFQKLRELLEQLV